MAEIMQWEYRVQTIGSLFGTKDESIEATLNEWGNDGCQTPAHPRQTQTSFNQIAGEKYD